ncbi:MAG: hypothetical protein DWQ35_20070 [Planctomycetota bacterium]|nr:MAG: hypothetical protein DWQ35_20070 [Planctomycetota bacterium]REK28380.1 MAG: hypothetical protein DWQ42_05230 [Planctomycetota bacterium]REK48396.1 MAG: hypothetical protein DWQ46_02380 [Planctomycetota bacterium]
MTATSTNQSAARSDPAQRMRTTMCATRISFVWFGTRKALSSIQKAQAAESFGAEGAYLSAGKKLLDTRHPQFKAVTSVRNRARSYWVSISLPYPEAGIRLVRQDALATFEDQMNRFKQELDEAVAGLEQQYAELKSAAATRLGSLYNEADYPASLAGLFEVTWDYPSIEPPSYLQQLNPAIYEQECRRVEARFSEAVQLAEQAFLDEFSQLVSHLTERLGGREDGRPKIFRDSAVENLREFFDRFRSLNVRSNEQLDALVAQCQQIVTGVEPQQLREAGEFRQQIASQLSGVQSVLDGLLVDRPRRRIIRTPK